MAERYRETQGSAMNAKRLRHALVICAAVLSLSGCAVYQAAPGPQPYYYAPGPVYSMPGLNYGFSFIR
jgi:hypothetical protein